MSAQRSFALRLYKTVLRAHRQKLPHDMRMLGDEYVRSEFRLHKTAKPEHVQPFFKEWISYLEQLQQMQPGQYGVDLTPEALAALSEEQQENLDKLREEAKQLRT